MNVSWIDDWTRRKANGDGSPEHGDAYEPPEDAPAVLPSGQTEWRTLAEVGPSWFDAEPPPREWLFKREDVGALAQGIVGTCIAPGGRGKTFLTGQQCLSVASGARWLDTFELCGEPGRVVWICAEEDAGEIRRRLYYAAQSLTPAQRQLALTNLTVLGWRGLSAALVTVDARTGTLVRTEVHARLVEQLSVDAFRLIVLDPLARFAPEAESNNAMASEAFNALEALSEGPGKPTVILVHHTSKASRRDGNQADGAAFRGVTGVYDSTRWEMQLAGSTEEDIELVNTKTNYGPKWEPVRLVRDRQHGFLRPPTSLEIDLRGVEAAAAQSKLLNAVRSAVELAPGSTVRAIVAAVKGRTNAVTDALKRLESEGLIVNRGGTGVRSRSAWYAVEGKGHE